MENLWTNVHVTSLTRIIIYAQSHSIIKLNIRSEVGDIFIINTLDIYVLDKQQTAVLPILSNHKLTPNYMIFQKHSVLKIPADFMLISQPGAHNIGTL